MPTTTNQGHPYPAPGASVNVPGDIQALAESVDNASPFFSAAAPATKNGRIWVNTSTGDIRAWSSSAAKWLLIGSANLMQASTTPVTTNSAGDWSITFPRAYLSGSVPTVVACSGEWFGGAELPVTVALTVSGLSSSTFNGRAYYASGAPAVSVAARINWVAVGVSPDVT